MIARLLQSGEGAIDDQLLAHVGDGGVGLDGRADAALSDSETKDGRRRWKNCVLVSHYSAIRFGDGSCPRHFGGPDALESERLRGWCGLRSAHRESLFQ